MRAARVAPGWRWIAILGSAGFAAGFLGPIVFVPEANQGPLVGIFISGPAGAALGLFMYTGCSLFRLPAGPQWRLLLGIAAAGVVATLIGVQPEPKLRAYVYDATVVACSPPIDAEARVLNRWRKRIAEANWAPPRSGWERDMHATLERASGVLVTVDVARRKSIYETRKPWDHGRLFAVSHQDADEKSFYAADGVCGDFPVGRGLQPFVRYDLNGRIEAPKDWPPTDLTSVLGASPYALVPGDLAAL
jgi:hypothetical protein